MKVIDLLNKIANGEEVPKRIQVYSDIFVLDEDNKLYEEENTRSNLLNIYNGNILNYEAVIIEEDKEIRKLPKEVRQPNNFEEVVYIAEDLVNKINEIIDKIEEVNND